MKNEKKTNLQTGATSSPTGGTVQIGSVIAYLGPVAPEGWLLCNGATIPPQYSQLIAMLGNNTPNLAGRTLLGAGVPSNATQSDGVAPNFDSQNNWPVGYSGGEYKQTLTVEQMPSHQHFGFGETGTNNWGTQSYTTNKGYTGSGKSDNDNYLFGSTFAGGQYTNPPVSTYSLNNSSVAGTAPGATASHNNMQPYYSVNYIVYAGTN